jgi:hypothetical protein
MPEDCLVELVSGLNELDHGLGVRSLDHPGQIAARGASRLVKRFKLLIL